jgi:DNA-binding response OmpR family regulator
LLVDDEEDIVSIIKKGLEAHGLEVDGFTSPFEALSSFKAGAHDLLILDIRMPGMTGIQLFREIRNLDADVKVLFLTAFEIQEKEWQMVLPNTDANGFIKKPVRIEYLVNTIVRLKSSPLI